MNAKAEAIIYALAGLGVGIICIVILILQSTMNVLGFIMPIALFALVAVGFIIGALGIIGIVVENESGKVQYK